MNRRLFFLFPDKTHAREVVEKLTQHGIAEDHMHTITKPGVDLTGLPVASKRQKNDLHSKIEKIAWNANLLVFFIALTALIYAFIMSNSVLAMFSSFSARITCPSRAASLALRPKATDIRVE